MCFVSNIIGCVCVFTDEGIVCVCVCVCVCIHRKGGHLPMSQLCGVIGTALFFDLYNTHTHTHAHGT